MPLVLICALTFLGAIAPFTERGTTDFDTFLQVLNPYGTWTQVGTQWQYFPLSPQPYVPMTSGSWIYTDFGWYWEGTEPFSWACDHYGTWKLGGDGVWSWAPDPLWQPFKVDFRATKTHIGWRCSAMDQFGDFVEKEESQRFAKPAEWVFVTREKFKGPITPADVVTGPAAAKLLEESEACTHVFVSWREMDRLGPDPMDFVPKSRIRPQSELKENEPMIVCPTVWTLPTFWTPRPITAKPEDLYVYRPRCAQDRDGIQRRILIWETPGEREKANAKLQQVLGGGTDVPVPVTPPKALPATDPALPATPPAAPAPASAPTPPPTPGGPGAAGSDVWKAKK